MEDTNLTEELLFDEGVTFSGLNKSAGKTRSEVEAQKIFDMIFDRDYDKGGYFIKSTGLMGSGKT